MPHTLSAQIAFGLYGTVCLFILILGGRYERAAGGVLLVELVLGNLTHDPLHGGPQLWLAGLDVLLLITFATIAYLSGTLWPLWATGLQLVATVAHGIKAIDPTIHSWAYLSTNILFGWLVLASVLVGSVSAALVRRRARVGSPGPDRPAATAPQSPRNI